jgi:Fe-S cluster assembly scaffold protein SufB
MKLINPTGKREIEIKSHEILNIELEDFSNKNTQFELIVKLTGEEAQCTITGKISANQKFKKNWKIYQVFTGKNQIGKINLKGVAENNAFLSLDGGGILEKNSQNGDIEISEDIRIFDKALGECLPVLTVKTDQVKTAHHAASVAPFDDELMLYLKSRGISHELAIELLKDGFLKN